MSLDYSGNCNLLFNHKVIFEIEVYRIRKVLFLAIIVVSLSSCYSYTTVVGNGPKEFKKETKWNHFFIAGLAQGKQSNAKEMSKNATDYNVRTRHTFGNYLVSFITLGIYTPTTTTVTR